MECGHEPSSNSHGLCLYHCLCMYHDLVDFWGMSYALAARLIEEHEGKVNKLYLDTKGVPTIGIGHNLNKGLSEYIIRAIFHEDMLEAEQTCKDLFPKWDRYTEQRQAALWDMSFNLGKTRLMGFKKMLAAIDREDWGTAAKEALDSKWAKIDVGPKRSEKVASLLIGK